MTGPELTVGRGVIAELVRLAALEVPGVVRVGAGGPAWRMLITGPAVRVRVHDDRVRVRLRVVARPGHSLVEVVSQVRMVEYEASPKVALYSAATPATCGLAMEVPLMVFVPPLSQVDVMLEPGA